MTLPRTVRGGEEVDRRDLEEAAPAGAGCVLPRTRALGSLSPMDLSLGSALADKLSEIETQTGQPKEYFIGAAVVLVSLLTFLLLPPGFIM